MSKNVWVKAQLLTNGMRRIGGGGERALVVKWVELGGGG